MKYTYSGNFATYDVMNLDGITSDVLDKIVVARLRTYHMKQQLFVIGPHL